MKSMLKKYSSFKNLNFKKVTNGLIGGNQEVRSAAADVVAKLAKSAGILLKPHLVCALRLHLMLIFFSTKKLKNAFFSARTYSSFAGDRRRG